MVSLLEKLDALVIRFEEIGKLISNPDAMTDRKHGIKLNKEYSELEKISLIQTRYKQVLTNIADAQTILEKESDTMLREIAKEELEESTLLLPQLEKELKLLLIPTYP